MAAGCSSCAQAKKRAVSSQRLAAERAAASVPPGYSADKPLVLGDEGGDVVHVRAATDTIPGMRIQNAYYVTGTGVQELVDAGKLELLLVAQKRRLWKVGGFVIPDEADAIAAAEKLGLTAVQVA